MTVTAIGNDYGALTAWVAWFDESRPLKEAYPTAALKKAEE